jgi:hypothetical protein
VQVSAVTQAQSISSDSWQATLESNFDIVDTFDELQNWHGITAVQGESSNPNDLPKRLDGSPSIWGRYSNWTGKPANEDWIKDNGFGKQVGTKSLKLSSTDGVSYMTTYFGDGTPNSGYSDIYIYFRMYVPRNAFPTRNVSNQSYNVDYVEGEPYICWDSFKWLNINTGFTSATGWNYDDPVSHPNRYGDTEIWYHLYRTQPNQIRPNLQTFFYRRLEYADAGNYADKLIGVEMHFKLENLAGHSGSYQGNGIAELWIYDESGNSNLILQRTDMSFRPASGSGHLFNRIQLEGNKHVSGKLWKCGPGMDCSYVVDDFIVNNTRIGPTYYALLNEIPLPPSFPRGDLNQDGTVNSLDWSIMNSAWGTSNTKADLNNDGIVNTIDFSILNSEW